MTDFQVLLFSTKTNKKSKEDHSKDNLSLVNWGHRGKSFGVIMLFTHFDKLSGTIAHT